MTLKHLNTAILAVAMALPTAAAGPEATWLQTEHDFGAFAEDMGTVKCQFLAVNTGSAPLTILGAHASCGCTAPTFSSDPIAPGDTAVITVAYNPFARPGRFDKKVKIKTNAKPDPDVLTIRGVVIGSESTLKSHYPIEAGALKLRMSVVPFGEIMKGRTKTAFLDIYNQSDDTIHPQVTGLPPFIDVTIAPQAIAPGEQATMTFFANTAKAGPDLWGLTESIARVSTLESPTEGADISLIAILNEDFSRLTPRQLKDAPRVAVSSTVIDLGVVTPDSRPQASITVENFGKDPLEIRRVVCADKALSIACRHNKIKRGQKATITFTLDPSLLPADDEVINIRVTLITNDPDHPSQPLRVAGEIRR